MSRLVEIKGYDGDYFISDCGDVFLLNQERVRS